MGGGGVIFQIFLTILILTGILCLITGLAAMIAAKNRTEKMLSLTSLRSSQ